MADDSKDELVRRVEEDTAPADVTEKPRVKVRMRRETFFKLGHFGDLNRAIMNVLGKRDLFKVERVSADGYYERYRLIHD
jgi:hypothetical protein